jgi:hypothetical protein
MGICDRQGRAVDFTDRPDGRLRPVKAGRPGGAGRCGQIWRISCATPARLGSNNRRGDAHDRFQGSDRASRDLE